MPFSIKVTTPDNKIAYDLSCFNDERCADAERWAKQTGWPLIVANKTWDEIKDTYRRYQMKPLLRKKQIDHAAISIYRKSTEQIYKMLKSKFDSDGKVNDNDTINMIKEEVSNGKDNDIIQYILEESKKNLPPGSEYNVRKIMSKYQPKDESLTFQRINFTPDEIKQLQGTYSDSPVKGFPYKKWLEAYEEVYNGYIVKEWSSIEDDRIAFLEGLTSMESLDRMKYNEALIRLGVNPEVSRYSRITVTPPIHWIDITQFIKSDLTNIIVNESNKFDLYKPVFIVFKRTKESMVNRIISKFTRSFWAHAAISFDSTLKECYTFDFHHNGFVKESIYSYPKGTIINVIGCFVSSNTHARMEEEISHYKKIKKQTSYNLDNLIHCLTKKANEDTKSMVCSNFVDYILKIGDISPSKMSWSIMTPGRLRKSIAHNKKKHFYELFRGTIEEYNANKVMVYLSKTNIQLTNEDSIDNLDKDTNKLYKELIEPFINLVPIEENPLVITNDLNKLSKLTSLTTYI